MIKYLFVFLSFILLQSCNTETSYTVKTIENERIVVDGKRIESAWSQADSITTFINPWDSSVSPSTSFLILRDGINLYFYFHVNDEDIVLKTEFSGERDVEKEDRVEIFLSADKDMNDYYCFEIDPLGRVLDYKAYFYRQFNFDWDIPFNFVVATQVHPDGYSVEGSIPLEFIQTITSNKKIYFGVYRAEFSKQGDSVIENWLTWIDPKVKFPDFHVPASLGRMILK